MSSENANYILVLDDDKNFRDLVGALLRSKGYEVMLARSAKEASAFLEAKRPGLAIVDYRLPEIDGMSWIAQVRENDATLPIVMVTGNWCDQKTFNWLRNILKVSLVLQKPIVPELFLHSLEGIAPPPPDGETPSVVASTSSNDSNKASSDTPDAELSLEALIELLEAGELDEEESARLKKLKRRIETQNAIAGARRNFLLTLPEGWNELTDAVKKARANPKNLILLQDAMGVAHKLKGTSGSYGYAKIGQFAERVENFLISVDPYTDTEQEVIWAEIIRTVTEGVQIISDLTRAETGESTTAKMPMMNCLAVIPEQTYQVPLKGAATDANCELEIVGSSVGAIVKWKKRRFEAAIIDLELDPIGSRFKLARDLRQQDQGSILPMCFIDTKGLKLTRADTVYGGASVLLTEDDTTRGALSEAMQILGIAGQLRRPRVLCIDDDPLLSTFVESVLQPQGITVRSLNEPIMVLEKMSEFQPDLILLDVIMPGLTGYEVCRLLKSTDDWAHVPVIFLTSKSDDAGKRAAFTAGGTDFLSKPVLVDELSSRVKAHLTKALSEGTTRIDGQSKVLTYHAFEREIAHLLELCGSQSQPLSLGMIKIADYDSLDINYGAFSAEHVVGKLGELFRERYRAEDLRGRFEEGVFALALPGESEETLKLTIELLKADWDEMWFPSGRGEEFQTGLIFSSAEFPLHGDNFQRLAEYALRGLKQKLNT